MLARSACTLAQAMTAEDAESALQGAIGYRFTNSQLLARALTHGSRFEGGQGESYERLEFLGDRVLGLVVAEALYSRDPDADEGVLARRLNALVRREACADRAFRLGIDKALRLGAAEAQGGGRKKAAILADACEAVLGAVYLDGGFDAARQVVLSAWGPLIDEADTATADAKTQLQEFLQAGGEPPPTYRIADRRGPDHKPHFVVEVVGAGGVLGTGEGGSKRVAEQAAAEAAIAALNMKGTEDA